MSDLVHNYFGFPFSSFSPFYAMTKFYAFFCEVYFFRPKTFFLFFSFSGGYYDAEYAETAHQFSWSTNVILFLWSNFFKHRGRPFSHFMAINARRDIYTRREELSQKKS